MHKMHFDTSPVAWCGGNGVFPFPCIRIHKYSCSGFDIVGF